MSRQNHGVHICSFEAVDLDRGDLSDYERFKHKVLLAGRFSVFEATENQGRAALYTRLSRDPEVVTEPVGFPWTKVSLAPASATGARSAEATQLAQSEGRQRGPSEAKGDAQTGGQP